MGIRILGQAKDLRTGTPVIYTQMSIADYLELVGDDFDDFRFQRKRVNYKPYERMKDDIKNGALLPSITLATKFEYTDPILNVLDNDTYLKDTLKGFTGKLNILDGLQRTYILQDIKNEGHDFPEEQTLLIEFWIESDLKNLIYRLIVLNAGQKKMSMRHQIELLFLNIKDSLETDIPDLQIHTQRENTRRNSPKKFPLDRLVMGYQSFLLKNTEVKRSNVVAQEMLENNVLDSSADELGEGFEEFKQFLKVFTLLDDATFNHYSTYSQSNIRHSVFDDMDEEIDINSAKHWFSTENVMNCFFAAVSKSINTFSTENELLEILNQLINQINNSPEYSDPLGLSVLYQLQKGINPKKYSVDFQTRQIIYYGFIEYFKEDGKIELGQCWRLGAF
ncbi:hypothetical protein IGI03_21600 [Bacillus thuringiensis]|uniref:hypothetical protein n=1 Tax=Bacillus thuringiensis TaxID=1428 RepID=UPI0018746C16|nr:hypothetical protein [Bacillus thuringiensis]MBE5090621.1 hypothetical protein [Bacillus thuringiensis]